MTAVIYARYSSDNQREESIEGQIRECTAFAEKEGIKVIRHYIDRALTAKTDNRPDFQQMIEDSKKGLFDAVIVWKLDRFSRSRSDSAIYTQQLRKNGVRLISATERIPDGSGGILLESTLVAVAEYFSVELAEKVVRGMTENVLKGKFNGGCVPLGFKVNSEGYFEKDEKLAPIIVEVFERYNSGQSITEIRDWLIGIGVKNSLGNMINYNNIHLLLRNRRYIGENKSGETITYGIIPVIVPKELFDSVQTKLQKSQKAPAAFKADEKYLLTTKIFCGHCGVSMAGESGTSRNKTKYRYYKCMNAKKNKSCKKKPIRKEWIEDIVVKSIYNEICNDKVLDAIVDAVMDLQRQENKGVSLLEIRTREVEGAINNVLKAIEQGIFTKSTKERLETLEAEKEDLERKLANEKIEKPIIPKEFVYRWLKRFRNLDITKEEHKQVLIDNFISSIYLYDDKVVVGFNYTDNQESISFDELNGCSDLQKGGEPKNKTRSKDLVLFFLVLLLDSNSTAAIRLNVYYQAVAAKNNLTWLFFSARLLAQRIQLGEPTRRYPNR